MSKKITKKKVSKKVSKKKAVKKASKKVAKKKAAKKPSAKKKKAIAPRLPLGNTTTAAPMPTPMTEDFSSLDQSSL